MKSEFPLFLTPVFSLWFSFNRYDSPCSMSRTKLITGPFFSSTRFPFPFTLASPALCSPPVQALELRRISVYRCVLGLLSAWEIRRGHYRRPLASRNHCCGLGLGAWGLGWSPGSPRSLLSQTPSRATPGGATKCRGGRWWCSATTVWFPVK